MKLIAALLAAGTIITVNPTHTYTAHFFVPNTEIRMPEPKITKQVCNVSAYTASADECGKNDGITASGERVKANHTIAADHLPFGTKVIINGHTYTVTDRFGGEYTDRLDIYMESKEEAFEFGRKEIEVEIIGQEGV